MRVRDADEDAALARGRGRSVTVGYSPRALSHRNRVLQIGPHLSDQRRRLGLTLAECESATKIRAKYLGALEEDRPGDLPDPVYVRIFLRGYATFLGLDARALLAEFDERHGGRGLRDQHQLVSLEPPEPGRIPGLRRWLVRPRRRSLRREAGWLAVGFAVAIAMLVWLSGRGGSPPPAPKPSTVPPAAARAARPPRHAAAAAVRLTLTGAGTGGSYVRVQRGGATGAVVFEGTLPPGVSVRILVSRSLWMRAGRPADLRVLLGGRSIPLTGAAGDFTVTRTGVTTAR